MFGENIRKIFLLSKCVVDSLSDTNCFKNEVKYMKYIDFVNIVSFRLK